jgi:hypothetical protein
MRSYASICSPKREPESAAIVAIVKQFFDGDRLTDRVALEELDEATAPLKAEIAKLNRRLAVLEEAFVSRKQFKSAFIAPYQYGPPPVLVGASKHKCLNQQSRYCSTRIMGLGSFW